MRLLRFLFPKSEEERHMDDISRISLTEARARMLNLLSKPSPGTRAFPAARANVNTTCVIPGTVPIHNVKPIPRIVDARQQLISDLAALRKKAESMREEDLTFALSACLELVTRGSHTLNAAIDEERNVLPLN